MSGRDYYDTLGLDRGASQQEIKSAYRKLAVRFHPDRNPGDQEAEARFKEAAEAYAVLSDPEKRARYDRFGHRGVTGGAGFGGFDPDIFGDFADILGDFFGFGARRSRQAGQPGADLRYELRITLEEAAFGIEKTLRIPRLESCETCSGSGAAEGTEPAVCNSCGGSGQVQFSQGFFTVARPCPTCRGEGRVISDPCAACRGEGRVEQARQIEVTIPSGVDSGSRLRLRGEGEHGRRGGRAGDLYIDLVVEEHDLFRRQGPHTLARVGISYTQAVLGTTVEVPTLHGPVTLDVPPGTAHGTEFRLPGKGVPRLGDRGKGDHLVLTVIDVPDPRRLDEEHLELLRGLAEKEGKEVREDKKVLDRVRDLFG
jgi:molecular chaperone DnaJ